MSSQQHKSAEQAPGQEEASYAEQAQDALQNMVGNSGVLSFLGWGEEEEVEIAAVPEAKAAEISATQTDVGSFDDGGGFFWEADGNAGFECVKTPEGQEGAIGYVVTEEKDKDAWAKLNAIYLEKVGEQEPEVPEIEAPAADDGETVLVDIEDLQWVLEQGKSMLEGALEYADEKWDEANEYVDGLWDEYGWASDEDEEQDSAGTAPSGSENSDRKNQHDEAVAEGKTDVLDEAIDLVDDSKVGHADDLADGTGRGMTNSEIWDELKSGEIDDMKNIKCSEFTAASMAAAGYDLDQKWVDPKSGMQVAYTQGSGIRMVEMWMVVGMLKEAAFALLSVQDGGGEEIDPKSERAKEIEASGETENFLFVGDGNFYGRKASADDHLGAGASVLALGGYVVDMEDRKPGDVQQRLDTYNGKYTANGHSSVVHAVRGPGIAYLGESGSPEVVGEVESPSPLADLEPGWYAIEAGSGLELLVGPGTDPGMVASIDGVEVQLIDANRKGSSSEGPGKRGSDATGLGGFQETEEYSSEGSSAVTCTGRLPTNDWFAWSQSSQEVLAVLSTKEPEASQET